MSKPHPLVLLGVLITTIAVLGGISVAKGGFLIAKHEGDTLHLMQIVLRMADGQIPHVDFMTPIGALAFAPIVFFVDQGMGIGQSILWAQVVVALALCPMAAWVGVSRLSTPLALLFGVAVMVLSLALVHGEAQPAISISMHYNRWAWGFSFIAIALAVLPASHRQSRVTDGLFAGLALSALAMIKVTYFAAFIIPITLGFLLRGQVKALIVGIMTGAVVGGTITLWFGSEFWTAYINDLMTVAQSDVRSFPGRSMGKVIGDPAFLGGSLIAIYAIIALRQAGQEIGGLLLLLLVPGFFYVTYQNFANDPQWLLLLAVLLLAFRHNVAGGQNNFGWELRSVVTTLGIIALTLITPSFLNLAYSPFRHMAAKVDDYSPILPRSAQHGDLMTANVRANRVDGQIALDTPGSGLEAYAELAEREDLGNLFGAPLPNCELKMGLPAWLDAIVTDLDAAGFAEGRRVFAADLLSSHWMFGPFLPLEGGAPWYYGNLSGLDSADYVLVPNCALSPKVRRLIVEAIEAEPDVRLEEIRRTPLYILLEKT